MKRSYKFIILGLLLNVLGIYTLDAQEKLPCLKTAYKVSDKDVRIGCQPASDFEHDDYRWDAIQINEGRYGDVIKGAVIKKRNQYYFSPAVLGNRFAGKTVVLRYAQLKDGDLVYCAYFKVSIEKN